MRNNIHIRHCHKMWRQPETVTSFGGNITKIQDDGSGADEHWTVCVVHRVEVARCVFRNEGTQIERLHRERAGARVGLDGLSVLAVVVGEALMEGA